MNAQSEWRKGAITVMIALQICIGSANIVDAACLAQPGGLTHWWQAEGNTSDFLGGASATLAGNAGFATGLVGQSFQLDGDGDYVEVASTAALNAGNADFTVDLWVNFNSTSGEQVLIEKWIDPSEGWTLTKLNGNSIQFAMTGTGNPTSAPQSLPTGTWHHFAAKRTGNTAKAFLNGVEILSGTVNSNLDSTSPLLIGRRSDGRGFFLDGRVDEVHMFIGTALSDSTIQAIHAAGPDGICFVTVCGDGARQGMEACDDGNSISGDGCENDCTLSCGNLLVTGSETCDDGNLIDGDGCDSNCTTTACGNGILTTGTGEECDDGNAVDGDGCKSDCTPNVCGDGFVNTGIEDCDDGNSDEFDGCESDCEIGGICIPPYSGLVGWWTGDISLGDIAGGNNAQFGDGPGWVAPGRVREGFYLDGISQFVFVPSVAALNAGIDDFTVDLWVSFEHTDGEQVLLEKYVEKFDPAVSYGWTLTKLAGNSILFVTKTGEARTGRLTLTPGDWYHVLARRSGTELSIFINGELEAQSTTDTVDDLTSSASLKFGHRGAPSDTPGSTDTRGFFLAADLDEVHYFNRALSDLEVSNLYNTGGAGFCVTPPACGNGLTEAGEQCDDGNAVSGDGCEPGCSLSCGNAIIDAGEACDDGDIAEGNGCDSNCTVSACGNGIVAPDEDCDDNNTVDGDGCDFNCTVTACGNSVWTGSTGEDCDDGNAVNGDGCEANCTITTVVEVLPPEGGTVTTDPMGAGASPQMPIQVALAAPGGGVVSIASSDQPLTSTLINQLVDQVIIEAPPATTTNPLRIELRVDASAIPWWLNLVRMTMVRNGTIVLDCTGPMGQASPDPCISERITHMDGDVTIVGLSSHASSWTVGVASIDEGGQDCLNGIARAVAKVSKVQGKLGASCLADADSAKRSDPQACTDSDADGKVSKAEQATTVFADEMCSPTPPFGFASAAIANAAGRQGRLALLADLLGANLDLAIADTRDELSCHKAVLKAVDRVIDAKTKIILGCAKEILEGTSRAAVSSEDLLPCFDAVAADAESKSAKAIKKLALGMLKKCGGILAGAFPGTCSAANDASYCFETRINCRICETLRETHDIPVECDLQDDYLDNGSCD